MHTAIYLKVILPNEWVFQMIEAKYNLNELKNQITIDQAWFYKIVPSKIENGLLFFLIDKNKITSEQYKSFYLE